MSKLPIGFGYVIKREPKAIRRTFAMQESLLDALKEISREKGTNLNALVNDILFDYVLKYYKEGRDAE